MEVPSDSLHPSSDILIHAIVGIASILVLYRALFGKYPYTTPSSEVDLKRSDSTNFDDTHQEYLIYGTLWKKGKKQGKWKQRFVALDRHHKLCYFDIGNSPQPVAANDIHISSQTTPKGAILVHHAVASNTDRQHSFSVIGRFNTSMEFSAESRVIQQHWLRKLNLHTSEIRTNNACSNRRSIFVSALSQPQMPVKHKLHISVQQFQGTSNPVGNVPTSSRKTKQYYFVLKFQSELHDFSHVPVGQTNQIKGSIVGGSILRWQEQEEQKFLWTFQDHDCASCAQCNAAAIETNTVDAVLNKEGVYHRGLPQMLVCQLWEVTMFRNKKNATARINLVDLFGYQKMEKSSLTCSWPMYSADSEIGYLKIELAYEAERATGKVPFLTSSVEEMLRIPGEHRTVRGVKSPEQFFYLFYADGTAEKWSQYYEARGDTEIQTGSWTESAIYGGKVREMSFRALTHSPIGPSTTMTTTTEHAEFNETKSILRIAAKAIIHDVPYGDCFTVETLLLITSADPENSISIEVFLAVPFSKGCMWKSKIISSTTQGVTESMDLRFRLLNEKMQEQGAGKQTVNDVQNGSSAGDSRRATPHNIVDATVALEEIFENQRLSIIGGWGAGHLLPTDRPRFTNRNGDIEMHFMNISPPKNWIWTSKWKIDYSYTECDEDGWSYATDFPRFKIHLQKGKSNRRKLGASVRRRRWIRTMCYAPAFDAESNEESQT